MCYVKALMEIVSKNIDSVFKLLEYVPQKKAFFIKPNLVLPLRQEEV